MHPLLTRRSVSLASLAILVLPLPWLAPGLLLAQLLRQGRGDGGDGLTRLPLALGAPAIALPWLRLLQVPWQETWLVVSVLALIALTVGVARSPERRWPPVAAIWLLLGAAIYLVPHWRLPAPSGVDMGMHLPSRACCSTAAACPPPRIPSCPACPSGSIPWASTRPRP